jgi:WXG100 family type VII secretion target
MATRFMTDPHAMRAMAGRFETHAQAVEQAAQQMWMSSMNIGPSWSGQAAMTSYDTVGQMNQAFRNIVNMLQGVRDGFLRDATRYEAQEQQSTTVLSS